MTVTAVPGVPTVPERLDDAEYQARVERLRTYVEQLEDAGSSADVGSLERAADLAAIYADKRWVDELPAPGKTNFRGRPVEADSFNRFAKMWAAEHITSRRTGKALDSVYCYRLRNADQVRRFILPGAKEVDRSSERALRPLSRLLKDDRGDQASAVWQRARQLAEGDMPTEAQVKKALADHNKATGYTQPRTRSDDGQSFTSVSKRFLRDAEWIVRNGTEAQRQKVIAELQARLAQLQQ